MSRKVINMKNVFGYCFDCSDISLETFLFVLLSRLLVEDLILFNDCSHVRVVERARSFGFFE